MVVTVVVNIIIIIIIIIIRSLRSRSAEAYSRQTFLWTMCRSVGPYVRTCVGRSDCSVHCEKKRRIGSECRLASYVGRVQG